MYTYIATNLYVRYHLPESSGMYSYYIVSSIICYIVALAIFNFVCKAQLRYVRRITTDTTSKSTKTVIKLILPTEVVDFTYSIDFTSFKITVQEAIHTSNLDIPQHLCSIPQEHMLMLLYILNLENILRCQLSMNNHSMAFQFDYTPCKLILWGIHILCMLQ